MQSVIISWTDENFNRVEATLVPVMTTGWPSFVRMDVKINEKPVAQAEGFTLLANHDRERLGLAPTVAALYRDVTITQENLSALIKESVRLSRLPEMVAHTEKERAKLRGDEMHDAEHKASYNRFVAAAEMGNSDG